MKHTVGPWKIETVNTQVGHCHKIIPIEACLYVDNQTLPHDSVNVDSQTALANALLIAASPELLEACKSMEAISNLWLPTKVSIEHRSEAFALHSARTKMINAIQKAEEGKK